MRPTFFAIFAALFVGCATAPDPIDHLVAELSSTGGVWRNGYFPILDLPQTASLEDVIKKRLNRDLPIGKVAHYKLLKIRPVHIPSETSSDLYTAVIVRLDSGDKIVLIKYEGPKTGWWSRVYDIKPSPNTAPEPSPTAS
jgi:hypothetical protein